MGRAGPRRRRRRCGGAAARMQPNAAASLVRRFVTRPRLEGDDINLNANRRSRHRLYTLVYIPRVYTQYIHVYKNRSIFRGGGGISLSSIFYLLYDCICELL